jgi:hypothetical protein
VHNCNTEESPHQAAKLAVLERFLTGDVREREPVPVGLQPAVAVAILAEERPGGDGVDVHVLQQGSPRGLPVLPRHPCRHNRDGRSATQTKRKRGDREGNQEQQAQRRKKGKASSLLLSSDNMGTDQEKIRSHAVRNSHTRRPVW